ncbi:MAG: LysR family transcriptional regulator [Desulfobacterales bacterium]|nr:LysR family transcriptional regulator [Desulfobacterales bacterium]MCP4159316.1 LysR family transcriptional regulator [Deltaproteobacteria bacterium]
MNLYKYDLNLLTIFDMIFSKGHLTKAGEILNLSQPAMSQALGRLREVFDDQLFVRSGKDMIPTSFAIKLAPKIREIMDLTEKTFIDRGDFDPVTSNRTFKLAMNDYTEMVIMPVLFNQLQKAAPNIKIRSEQISNDYENELSHNLDFILGCDIDFGANVYQKSLFNDREVVAVRCNHPVLMKELTPEIYSSLKHAQFKYGTCSNTIDKEFNKIGLKRDIVLEIHHEMVLPLMLKDSDLIINIPERMAKVFKEMVPFEIIELPFVTVDYNFCQYWHERNHKDPAHIWFRSFLNSVADSL